MINSLIKKQTGLIPISAINSEDIVIVGYPKSGNTWMQNICASLHYGVNPVKLTDSLVQTLVPDVHYKRYYKRLSDVMFFKSHEYANKKYKKVIYLVRDPRDVYISYWHFLKAVRKNESIKIEDVIKTKKHIKVHWHEHVKSWLSRDDIQLACLRYEDIQVNGIESISKNLDAMKYSYDQNELKIAVEGNVFSSMRSREEKFGLDNPKWPGGEQKFMRKGESGGYKEELDEVLIRIIEEDCGYYMDYFNYI